MAEIGGDDGKGRQGIGGKADLELQVTEGQWHRLANQQRPNPRRLAAALAQAPGGLDPHCRHVQLPFAALGSRTPPFDHP